ncbi:4-(cytidine 5'-diphospho)-2-C-methyl-D-erythritol kinase, partial [Nocardioides sp.]|uniref:4-(cytidine 5'-diphospho)-2-C-methyl-D-erythritol kinase n=1 Tax=Nocardioides sp. TaxID=35761 RepID=UPI0027372D49
MISVTVRAPAKINLHLGVGAPRPDGYHPLHTVYTSVGLYDDLTITRDGEAAGDPGVPVGELELSLTAAHYVDAAQVPLESDNIVHRAAALLGESHGTRLGGDVHIAKSIPVAGGLAGGSADAAAALVALDRLWGLQTTDEELLRIASALGSDVPFALLGGTALGTGRGELVEPVTDNGAWWWVAVPDREGLSTPAVYRHFDELHPDADPEPPQADELLAALEAGDVRRVGAALRNDLQAAAIDLRPELGELISR